jgi:hypothetical protein
MTLMRQRGLHSPYVDSWSVSLEYVQDKDVVYTGALPHTPSSCAKSHFPWVNVCISQLDRQVATCSTPQSYLEGFCYK